MESENLRVVDNTKEFKTGMKGAIAKALEMIGLTAEGYAKENITHNGNIDTGALRNSITHVVKDKELYIGTNIEYAAYVECGTGIYYEGGRKGGWVYYDDDGKRHFTYGSRPYPFLKPAAENHSKEYRAMFESVMENG